MTRAELYDYLDSNYEENFLVKCPEECLLHFMYYEGAYFESPVTVHAYEMTLEEYMEEMYGADAGEEAWAYEREMQRGDKHFVVDAYQSSPWIDEIEIIRPMTDSEVVDYIIANEGKPEIKRFV